MRNFSTALNIGAVRKSNQDQVLVLHHNEFDLMVVCDGMGGANAGEVASQMTVDYIQSQFENNAPKGSDFEELKRWMMNVLNQANLQVLKAALLNPNYRGMGTTAVCALFSNSDVLIANVGDSRAYFMSQDKLQQISEDHSLVSQWIKEGKLSAEEAKRHPQRSVLTNVLGVSEDMSIDIFHLDRHYDLIFLCSDGVCGMLDDDQIQALIQKGGSIQKIVKRIEKASMKVGGYDNIAIAMMEEKV